MNSGIEQAVKMMKSKNVAFPLDTQIYANYNVIVTEIHVPTRHGRCHTVIFQPAGSKETLLPLAINLHGGAFVKGIGPKDVIFCANMADTLGCVVADIDYSTAPEAKFPVGVDQSYDVSVYLKEHAAEFGADSEKMFVLGHSAGGNVAAGVCLMDSSNKEINFRFQFLDYPALDVHTPLILKKHAWVLPRMSPTGPQIANLYFSDEDTLNPLASPVLASEEMIAGLPTTLIFTCAECPLQDEGELYADKLRDAGVTVISKKYKHSQHGFLVLQTGDECMEAQKLLFKTIKAAIN